MKTVTVIFVLLLMLLADACQSPASNSLTQTGTEVFSTVIPSTSSPTQERSTPTALPSISANNTKQILEIFVQGNGGCRLPCIMGLTPGLSESTDVNGFIQYFQNHARDAKNQINDIEVWSYQENNQGGISLRFFEKNKSVSIGLGYITDGNKVNRILLSGEAYRHLENGVKKQFGDHYFDILLSQFMLTEILNLYGPPDQILIWPFPDDIGHPSPPAQYTFDFLLLYPKRGFLVQYITERGERDEYYVGCPTKPYSLNISSWDPSRPLDLTDAVEYFSNIDGANSQNVSAFKSLEDATSHNISQFYEIFRIPNSNECIETPKELWP